MVVLYDKLFMAAGGAGLVYICRAISSFWKIEMTRPVRMCLVFLGPDETLLRKNDQKCKGWRGLELNEGQANQRPLFAGRRDRSDFHHLWIITRIRGGSLIANSPSTSSTVLGLPLATHWHCDHADTSVQRWRRVLFGPTSKGWRSRAHSTLIGSAQEQSFSAGPHFSVSGRAQGPLRIEHAGRTTVGAVYYNDNRRQCLA